MIKKILLLTFVILIISKLGILNNHIIEILKLPIILFLIYTMFKSGTGRRKRNKGDAYDDYFN